MMNALQRRVAQRRVARDWPEGKRVIWNPYSSRPSSADYTGTIERARSPGRDQRCVLVRMDHMVEGSRWCRPCELREG